LSEIIYVLTNVGLGGGILYVFYRYVEQNREYVKTIADLKASIDRLIATQERFITAINLLLASKKNNNMEAEIRE